MQTFKQFLKEGGNVVLGGEEAQKIDLEEIPRDEITDLIFEGLQELNKKFESFAGIKLWSDKVFDDLSFLSGSSVHFFNKEIPTDEFKQHKPKVGDIDTQVDETFEEQITEFLNQLSGNVGPIEFLGSKKSPGQKITLWKVKAFDVNVQIDLELSEFSGGAPTPWSQFSHSSSWADMKENVKGVFHKFALRAITQKDATEKIIVRTPGGKKEKTMQSGELSFSVGRGLRKKIEPVLNDDGTQLRKDDMLVFREKPTSESSYITDLKTIFKIIFDEDQVSDNELDRFRSFVGICQLIDKKLSSQQKSLFLDGFLKIIWGRGAQELERDDPKADYEIKSNAWRKAKDLINAKPNLDEDRLIQEYYQD